MKKSIGVILRSLLGLLGAGLFFIALTPFIGITAWPETELVICLLSMFCGVLFALGFILFAGSCIWIFVYLEA